MELLRASGIPAYFVYGTVEMPVERTRMWLDVKDTNEVIEAFQRNGIPAKLEGDNLVFEHVWVEAYIPFEDGSRWMPLDPSFNIVDREPIEVEYENASVWFNGTLCNATYSVRKANSSINSSVNETQISWKPGKLYGYEPLNFTIRGYLGWWSEIPESYTHKVSVTLSQNGSVIFSHEIPVSVASTRGIFFDY